jgi:hypothetical protein
LLARTFIKELMRKAQYNFTLFPCGATQVTANYLFFKKTV